MLGVWSSGGPSDWGMCTHIGAPPLASLYRGTGSSSPHAPRGATPQVPVFLP